MSVAITFLYLVDRGFH